MQTLEILSKLTAKTQGFDSAGSGHGDLGWQDILQAMQGIGPEKSGFVLYVYGDYERGRHDFFAGLFMAAMARPDVQAWILQHEPGQIEKMTRLAVVEWKGVLRRITVPARASWCGVSQSTWKRHYRDIYQYIYAIPMAWEEEIIKIIEDRLR